MSGECFYRFRELAAVAYAMLSALAFTLAYFASVAAPYQVPIHNVSWPTLSFSSYPATAKQPFVFTVRSHAATERIHAQLWARTAGDKRWVCINYDLSHPERRDVMVEECGVLLPKYQARTVCYTLTEFDLYMLRDLKCVVNKQIDVKIKIKSCTTWGLNFGESKETRLFIL